MKVQQYIKKLSLMALMLGVMGWGSINNAYSFGEPEDAGGTTGGEEPKYTGKCCCQKTNKRSYVDKNGNITKVTQSSTYELKSKKKVRSKGKVTKTCENHNKDYSGGVLTHGGGSPYYKDSKFTCVDQLKNEKGRPMKCKEHF